LPTALIGHGEAIRIPREETRPDWEGELAVVIGSPTYRATFDNAIAAVGGYTAINDVSGRRAQLETPLRQFVYGKSFDTFAPLGPSIASAEGVDFADIDVSLRIDGELMQESNTRHLIFSVAHIIEYVSRGISLEPGDVIATGTPGGVGDSRVPPRYLQAGETVEVTVSGVGTLSNPVTVEQ
jgi:2-keto-4-pentenoate hydratase/2-oxohepta-3-ene-1,7-dioic acid hydratase in catechol pathway